MQAIWPAVTYCSGATDYREAAADGRSQTVTERGGAVVSLDGIHRRSYNGYWCREVPHVACHSQALRNRSLMCLTTSTWQRMEPKAMSQPKVVGAGAAAAGSLPLTGNSVPLMVLLGLALVAAGLLFLRGARLRDAT